MSLDSRAFGAGALSVLLAPLVVSVAGAQGGVIVHEYIPPDAVEDLALGVMTPLGRMPAAIRTPSGVISAPDVTLPTSSRREPVYGKDNPTAARWRVDGITSDPGTLRYHECFRPSVAPFKRTFVFDAVNEAFELVVFDPALREVALESSPRPGDDEFFADLVVTGGSASRLASVAAGMRVLGAELEPMAPFELMVDSAENWFLHAPKLMGIARLVLRLAAPRAAFSPLVESHSYAVLNAKLPPVPAAVRTAAEPVLSAIGVSRVFSPTDAVRVLVGYFRSFAPSTRHIMAEPGAALYQQLALSRQGVCRHRAYAFVVTALALGIPARFVHNEAHAWVEVFDGQLWHRIDLGGAASALQYYGGVPEGPAYRAPADSYNWPNDSRPGDALLGSAKAVAPAPGAPSQPNPSYQRLAPPISIESAAEPKPVGPVRPRPHVVIRAVGNPEVFRGDSLSVEGEVRHQQGICRLTRVDVALARAEERHALGSTATDNQGKFHVNLRLPLTIGVGSYDLTAHSGTSVDCAPSASN
jgi:hypothetical protein